MGAPVRVKSGVVDPDFPDITLSGWTGTVAEVDDTTQPPLVRVVWSKATRKARPIVTGTNKKWLLVEANWRRAKSSFRSI